MTRGSASSVLSATTSRAVTPFLPFKTIALCDAYDFYIQKGSPVIKVVKILSQTSNPITAKISTAIGGKGRTFNSFPKKGDTMYAVQAMGDDMPIIFAYANGYNGNLNNPTPVDDEKFISLSGSYFWYKKSGSYNINVKLNYVAEIGKDYALKAKKSVSIETLDMSISCQSYAVTSSARINIITKAMYAKAENIKIKANATAIIESPKICLGSQSADQPAVLGKRLLDWINTHTHTGNLGYPTTPPLTPLPASVLSTIVKLK
jgi:uncharacterized protein (UPF0333 family)